MAAIVNALRAAENVDTVTKRDTEDYYVSSSINLPFVSTIICNSARYIHI